MNGKFAKRLMLVVLLTFVLSMGVLAVSAKPNNEEHAAVAGTYSFYSAGGITTTTYTNRPYVGGWGDEVEIFITAEQAYTTTTVALTATVQVSYDQSNWVDLYSEYIAESTTTTVVTGTSGMTATVATADAIQERTYSLNFASVVSGTASTDYMVVPVNGLYMRVTLVPSGTVTPTVKAVRR